MDEKAFTSSRAGDLVPTIEGWRAFAPKPLPPDIAIERIAPSLARARASLGELRGIGRALPNPYLFTRPLRRSEAVASSNIEGTYTSLSDLLLLEAGADETRRRPDTREVLNYVRALEHGIERLADLSICLRLLREMHRELLSGVATHRGGTIVPGEFRAAQNWIGAAEIAQARFVPPPANRLDECLDRFERYLNEEDSLDPLVRCALIHYQFEAIHPFPDGNGRVGRLLIPLYLRVSGLLTQPLLYLSAYFERNYETYIDRMYDVSAKGAWERWIEFFLDGVTEQSDDAIVRIERLQDLQRDYRSRLQGSQRSTSALRLMDELFGGPVLTVPMARDVLGLTYRAARSNVDKLLEAGVLSEVDSAETPRLFVAWDIVEIVEAPHGSLDPPAAEAGPP